MFLCFCYREEPTAVALHLLEVLGIGVELITQIKIVQKGIAFIADIYEAGVEPRHELLHLSQVDVANREGSLARFVLVFHEPLVFKQCD